MSHWIGRRGVAELSNLYGCGEFVTRRQRAGVGDGDCGIVQYVAVNAAFLPDTDP